MPKKVIKKIRTITQAHAYVETMTKTPAKFQKELSTTVRGVASTRCQLSMHTYNI